jgi:hypothetical protein
MVPERPLNSVVEQIGAEQNEENDVATTIQPGESLSDLSIEVTGYLIHSVQLSPSLAMLTLALDKASKRCRDLDLDLNVLDVLLKRQDGWEPDHITSIFMALLPVGLHTGSIPNSTLDITMTPCMIKVQGYPERMRPKSATDTAPLSLHAQSIQIGETVYQAVSKPAIELQQNQSTEMETEPRPTTSIVSSKKNNRGAKDASRFGKLVQFLLAEFGGYEGLVQKPVLDIAGGAGGLAFELSVRHAIPCIVVDTQPVKYKGSQVRHLKFRKQCLEKLVQAAQSPLAQNLRNRFQSRDFVQYRTLLDTSWVLSSEEDDIICRGNETQKQLRSILHQRNCSVLVGLHPDQATDPIIDVGLALQIPWAIVPCCVFPTFFQQRRLKCGKVVRTYEDLCHYILQKDTNVQQATLPFRGRNEVFFWHPQTTK